MKISQLSVYSGIIIKAIDIILLTLLVNVALVTLVRVELELPVVFDRMVALGFVIYFISAYATFKLQFKVPYSEMFLPVMGLITVALAIGLGLKSEFSLYKMSTFAAYVLIWIFGSNYRLKHDRIIPTRNRFYWSLIGLSIIFYLGFPIKVAHGYEHITTLYFPIYCIISLLNMNLVNMRSAYELMDSKAINKDANVSRFSTLALTVAIGLVFIAQIRFWGIWSYIGRLFIGLRDLIIAIIKILVYPFALLIEVIVKLIRSFAPTPSEADEVVGAMSGNRKPFDTGIVREGFEITKGMERALEIFAWLIIACISFFVLYKIYQRIASKAVEKHTTGQEERSFVFSLKDAFSDLRVKSLKRSLTEELPKEKIRLLYRQALIDWRSRGHEKLLKETPNEFLKSLKQQSLELDDFESLTENYNALRYGDKCEDYLSN